MNANTFFYGSSFHQQPAKQQPAPAPKQVADTHSAIACACGHHWHKAGVCSDCGKRRAS